MPGHKLVFTHLDCTTGKRLSGDTVPCATIYLPPAVIFMFGKHSNQVMSQGMRAGHANERLGYGRIRGIAAHFSAESSRQVSREPQ